MRVWFISAESHYTPRSGGGVASRAFYQALQLACGADNTELLLLKRTGVTAGLPRVARRLLSVARSFFSDFPSTVLFNLPGDWRRQIDEHARGGMPDLVVFNSAYLCPVADYFPPDVKVIPFSHNVEHRIFEGLIDRNRVFGKLMKRDMEKLRRLELASVERAPAMISVSPEDVAVLEGLAAPIRSFNFVPGPTYPPYRKRPRGPAGASGRIAVGFIGRFDWWPNREAARWFVDQVLGRIPPGRLEVHLFGAGSETFAGSHPDLVAHGFVDSLEEVWTTSDFMICPMISGSGVNIKLIEAIYNHMPVLATSVALRGLPPLRDDAIQVRDGAEAWVEFLSGGPAEQLAGRRVPESLSTLFSIDRQALELRSFVDEIVAPAPPVPQAQVG